MFLLFIFFLFFLSHASVNTGENVKLQTQVYEIPEFLPIQKPVLVINNYQNNDQKLNNTNTSSSNPTQNNSNDNRASLTNQIKQSVLNFLNFAKKEIPKKEVALSFFEKHKTMVLLGIVGCVYSVLFLYMYALSNFLADKEGWHNWRRELSFQELAMSDPDELTHALVLAIRQEYFTVQDLTNSKKSFSRFCKDVVIEIEKINRYIQIGGIIEMCQLSYFFPVNKKRLKRAVEKRKKLEFMQKLLITHMMAQNGMPMTRSYALDTFIKKYFEIQRLTASSSMDTNVLMSQERS